MSASASRACVYLMRHARAGWAPPGMRDFDRALDAEGRAEAERMGRAMAEAGHRPQRVLCSTAKRCAQTWEIVSRHVAVADIVFDGELYGGDGDTYLSAIRRQEDVGSVLVLGHNPMTEAAAHGLLASGAESGAEPLRTGFPTASLAVFDLEAGFARAGRAPARLVAFLTPGNV